MPHQHIGRGPSRAGRSTVEDATVEYQQTHMNKGDTYDATISTHPFDAYMARTEAAYLREIVPTLADCRSRYLDFACGTGRITETVSPLVGDSVGVDISDSMLGAARQKCPAVRFVCMDIAHDSEVLGQFDLATSFRFFGNAEDDLRHTVLRALSGLVRPGGHLIVNSHRNPRALGTLVMGSAGRQLGMDLTLSKFRQMLLDHSFEVVAVRSIGLWLVRARARNDAALLESSRAARMEGLFRHRIWAPLAPDCVIVARRR